MRKIILLAIVLATIVNCRDSGNDEEASPDFSPSPLIDPAEKAMIDCPAVAATAKDSCRDPLLNPIFCLDFDSADELAEKGITVTGDIDFSLPGRDGVGHSARPLNGYIALPLSKVLDLNNGSVSLWIAAENEASLKNFFYFLSSDPTSEKPAWSFYLARHASTDYLEFYSTNDKNIGSDSLIMSPISAWVPGRWYHIAVTWDLTTAKMYIDGRLAGTIKDMSHFPRSGSLPDSLYLLSSNRSGHAREADGSFRVDIFRSFNKSLDENEIQNIYQAQLDHTGPIINAGRMQMNLLGRQDGFGIDSIVDTKDGNRSKTTEQSHRQLWTANFEKISITNTSSIFGDLSCKKMEDSDETILRLDNIPISTSSKISTLTHFTPSPVDNEIGVSVSIDNAGNEFTLKSVKTEFAGILPPKGSPEDTNILLPAPNFGSYVKNPFVNDINDLPPPAGGMALPALASLLYPSRYFSMQWLGLVDEKQNSGGIYIGAHDGTASLKSFAITRAEDTANPSLDIGIVSLTDEYGKLGNDHIQTWPLVIGIQDGTWYDLARRYRKFAVGQVWAKKGPIAQRTDRATWMEDAGMIQSSSGDNVIALDKTAKTLGAPDGLVLWHFNLWQKATTLWGQQAQMNDTPAAEATQTSLTRLNTAESDKIPTALYFLPTVWDSAFDSGGTQPVSRDVGELNAMRNTDDSIKMENASATYDPKIAINKLTQQYVKMCPSSLGWQTTVDTAVQKMMRMPAVKGIYLDVLATGSPSLCFPKGDIHRHAPGSNHYYVDGFREMLTTIRNTAKKIKPEAGFYSEGFSDPYIDLIDGYLTIFTSLENPLPLAQAVYHDYAQFLGQEDNIQLESLRSIFAKQGQFFAWGGMPGFLLWQTDPQRDKTIKDHVIKLAKLRRYFKDFLVLGDMMPPPEILLLNEAYSPNVIDIQTQPPSGASAVQKTSFPLYDQVEVDKYNTGKKEEDKLTKNRTVSVPQVIASAWSNGAITGVVIVSLDGEDHVVYLPTRTDKPATNLFLTDESGKKQPKGTLSKGQGIKVSVPKNGVVLLTLE